MSDDEYGPCLPPEFSQSTQLKARNEIGPTLPPHLSGNKTSLENSDAEDETCIGPVLPPHLKKNYGVQEESSNSSAEEDNSVIGPVLPPGFGSHKGNDSDSSDDGSFGPSLPKNLQQKSHSSVIGPAIPPGLAAGCTHGGNSDSDSDDEIIGPLPSMMIGSDVPHRAAAEFEQRAKKMKDRLEGKDSKEDKIVRETWMTELPSTKLSQSIGLCARTFRAHAGPDLSDQSAWTDTPADRERKLQGQKVEKTHKRSVEDDYKSERDKKLKKDVEDYNKSKRGESLMEIHQKKMKKDKESKEDKPKVRREFDREVDLQVNRFDDAQRKSLIKKAQKLDSRFGHGSTQFL